MQHPQLTLGLCLLLVPYYNEHNVDSCHLLLCHAVPCQPHPVLSHIWLQTGNDSSAALMKNVCWWKVLLLFLCPPLVMCFHPSLRQLWHVSVFAERIQLTNPEEKHLLGTWFSWLCEVTHLKEVSCCWGAWCAVLLWTEYGDISAASSLFPVKLRPPGDLQVVNITENTSNLTWSLNISSHYLDGMREYQVRYRHVSQSWEVSAGGEAGTCYHVSPEWILVLFMYPRTCSWASSQDVSSFGEAGGRMTAPALLSVSPTASVWWWQRGRWGSYFI